MIAAGILSGGSTFVIARSERARKRPSNRLGNVGSRAANLNQALSPREFRSSADCLTELRKVTDVRNELAIRTPGGLGFQSWLTTED